MKQKTAMMELIDDLENDELSIYKFINDNVVREYYLKKEKEQIIEAYDRGKYYSHNRKPREYYNETYKQD